MSERKKRKYRSEYSRRIIIIILGAMTSMTTRRQSFALGLPPLPSSKKSLGVERISRQQQQQQPIESNHHVTTRSVSRQRGNSPLNRGALHETPLSAAANESNSTIMNRVLGKRSHSNNTSLQRRRSLPVANNNHAESVPSAKKRGNHHHFLHGIALDECRDILALPDPPSPSSPPPLTLQTAKRYSTRRRRQTDTFVPLRDLSNGEKDEEDLTADSSSSPNSSGSSNSMLSKRRSMTTASFMHVRKPKRSRLSLPSLTSPIVSKKSVASATKSTAPASRSLHPPPPRQLCNEQGFDSALHAKTKKTECPTFRAPPPEEQVHDMYQVPSQPETAELCKIQTLVHAYTALPVEKRFESQQAKAIEAASGYPLVPSLVPPSAAGDADKNQRRRTIIANLPTRLRCADECKIRDAQLVQTITECRVQKLRGGHVEYTHIPTGRAVPPREFEARYLCMIDEIGAVRNKSWGNYFTKLAQEIKAQKLSNDDVAQEQDCMCSNELSSSPPPTVAPTSGNITQDEPVPAVAPPQEENNKNDTSSQEEIQNMKTSDSCSHEPEGENLCTNVIYKTLDTTASNTAMHQPNKDATQRKNTPDKKLPRRPPSPTSPDMLLPFPLRNEPSSNPLIARAEQKLWNTIDDALATYSKEVLEIQAATTRK